MKCSIYYKGCCMYLRSVGMEVGIGTSFVVVFVD